MGSVASCFRKHNGAKGSVSHGSILFDTTGGFLCADNPTDGSDTIASWGTTFRFGKPSTCY